MLNLCFRGTTLKIYSSYNIEVFFNFNVSNSQPENAQLDPLHKRQERENVLGVGKRHKPFF